MKIQLQQVKKNGLPNKMHISLSPSSPLAQFAKASEYCYLLYIFILASQTRLL
jgi:hypothetical protein